MAKQLELATVSSTFEESLYKFEGEDKQTPQEVADNITKLEREISTLQTAQSRYNLGVTVVVGATKEKLTLEQAVKLVGGAGRVAKLWRNAAKGEKRDRYGYGDRVKTRKADEVTATATVTREEALTKARNAESFAGSLRNAIAFGNTTELDLDIPQELFS